MGQYSKQQKIISMTVIGAMVLSAVVFLANFESKESKMQRLNNVAKTLPEFNARRITANQVADGECEELTDSSALPVLVDRHKIDEETYTKARQAFIAEAKQQGIVWKDSDVRPSAVFDREGKAYKVATYTSSHSDGVYYNISLTACN